MNHSTTHHPVVNVDRALVFKGIAIALFVIALFALWRWTPLKEWATVDNIKAVAGQIGNQPFAPLIFIGAYTLCAITFFPRPLITMAAVIAFGAWLGFFYAMLGIIISSIVTYAVGRMIKRENVDRMAGDKLDDVISKLKKANFLIVSAVRLVPIAPFIVINLIAGAIRVKLSHFVIGTAIGMLPGALIATVFANQFNSYVGDSGGVNYPAIAGVIIMWLAIAYGVRKWWVRQS